MDFWGSLWRAAGDNQIAFVSQMQSFTSRAAEDVVRMTGSQVASIGGMAREATNAVRETASHTERPQRKAG